MEKNFNEKINLNISNTNSNYNEKCLYENHLTYLMNLDKTKDAESIGFYTNEYLKMAGKKKIK